MNISFICPSRNNLKYLQWSLGSIIKNKGDHEVEFCVWDDFSDDGTAEWLGSFEQDCLMLFGVHLKWGRNDGPERIGLTKLYNDIVRRLATNDLCIIWHADMYLCPGALDAIEDLMYENERVDTGYDEYLTNKKPIKNRIVSLTRIEPPLHPGGKEKITRDFGIEPENFNEQGLLNEISQFPLYLKKVEKNILTKGVFAPWVFWKDEFLEIGGHDLLFSPQTKEDSDIWNRFKLYGNEFIQTWQGFVYHLTCRGSRFNPTLTIPGINSYEWENQNAKSMRNFIRKWGSLPLHDEFLNPIVVPKYNIGFIVKNSYDDTNNTISKGLLYLLEIWCDAIIIDLNNENLERYIDNEQGNTKFDLRNRVYSFDNIDKVLSFHVVVEIDGNRFGETDFKLIQNLSRIIEATKEEGEYELGTFKVTINNLRSYEQNLIYNENSN